MASHFLYRVIRLASALGIFSVVCGCASTPVEQEVFMGEGFQSSLPDAEARVLVWGNHSGAMTRTLGWLHDHQISAVDPAWIEKELTDPIFDRRTRMEQKRQVLAAAKSVGASLVLFTQVEDSQMGWKFDVMSFGHKRMKFIGVEIRGMKADTGDVVFGAKAWNSEPLAASEQLVMALTTFALEKAFREPQPSFSLQQNVQEQESPSEHVAGFSTRSDEEITGVKPASQSVEDLPTVTSQISARSVYAGSEETMDKVVTTRSIPVDDNIAEAELQSSWSLQQKVPRPEASGEYVPGLSAPSDEAIPSEISASQQVENEPTILGKHFIESVDSGYQDKAALVITPMKSSTDERTSDADLPPFERSSTDDSSVGLQVASGALSLLYTPIKVTYAVLGGFFGSFAYLLTGGNEPVAQSIWDASLQGDYWVTAKHIQGEEAINFKGEPSPMDAVQQVRIDDTVVE